MTAPNSVDPARFLHDQLASASLDLLRSMLTTFVNTLMMSGVYLVALVSFPWVGSRPLRSLRGRPSQVKGAFGVATRCRFAAPWTCESPRPLRAGATGRPGACPPPRAAPPSPQRTSPDAAPQSFRRSHYLTARLGRS